jgi:hypothetical protein
MPADYMENHGSGTVGNTGLPTDNGLAIKFRHDGVLFGATFTDLYTIDPSTAQATLVGALAQPVRDKWFACFGVWLEDDLDAGGQGHENVPADSQPEAPQFQSVPMPLLVHAKHSGYVTIWVGCWGFVVSTEVSTKHAPPRSGAAEHGIKMRGASAVGLVQDQPAPPREHEPSAVAIEVLD